jgi:2-keto-4-pentenoate hydratase/2-oxohepta-3-ene-1,7-dioic acid hydratase in catechol pathway
MKIICIGRNYAAHADELKNEIPENPVIFMKPDTALVKNNAPVYYPDFTEDLHYEVELVVRISKMGKYIEEKFASKYYDQFGLGIDFTARDIQSELKQKGLPWERAKAFDQSAVIGEFWPKDEFNDHEDISFELLKNNEVVQRGNTSDMLFGIDRLVSNISQICTLKVGDMIFTGTPSGVGPVKRGDSLRGVLNAKVSFDFPIL